MAHEVRVKVYTKVVANKDVEIIVKTDGSKLGSLLISKGNMEWLPKGTSVNKKRLSWTKFAALMESEGRTVKAKKATAG